MEESKLEQRDIEREREREKMKRQEGRREEKYDGIENGYKQIIVFIKCTA